MHELNFGVTDGDLAMDGNLSPQRPSRLIAIVQRAGWFLSGMAVVGVCLLFRSYAPAEHAAAKPPASPVKKASATEKAKPSAKAPVGTAAAAPKKNPIAAVVNNEPITRDDLAQECLVHYGEEVLESIMNRSLIQASCEKRKITISDAQVDEEIDRMARRFSLTKDQWVKMLEKERGIKPNRYAKDIVWPTLALRELAKNKLTVSKQELEEAYESEFGPSVKVRLIAIDSAERARKVHAEAVAKPEEFPALAKKYSKDTNSASAYGLIQPIRHHAGDPTLEKIAFALKKGEVSKIVQVGEMHVFIKCEEHLPPPKGVDRAKVEPTLIEALKDRKLRVAASDVFKELQKDATIVNVMNDPVKSKQMPGVAAMINDQKITLRELAEECLERHGTDVLEGSLNRKLIEQALRKKNIDITDEDVNAEVARAALSMGKLKTNGEPDVEAWLDYVTKGENISRKVYLRDEVWPSAGLKKLVGDNVKITQEDLQRGYDANYGPKAQCRAIVVNSHRRGLEVWEKARDNMTVENFGDLAEQYSIEAGSRALRGEVPPIQKNGGQPLLEKEAFALKPGQISGVICVGNTWVILFCEGFTKPIDTNFEEVKDMLYRDIHEKKQRIAMAKAFDSLKEEARIENYLTGSVKTPKREEQAQLDEPKVQLPTVRKR